MEVFTVNQEQISAWRTCAKIKRKDFKMKIDSLTEKTKDFRSKIRKAESKQARLRATSRIAAIRNTNRLAKLLDERERIIAPLNGEFGHSFPPSATPTTLLEARNNK